MTRGFHLHMKLVEIDYETGDPLRENVTSRSVLVKKGETDTCDGLAASLRRMATMGIDDLMLAWWEFHTNNMLVCDHGKRLVECWECAKHEDGAAEAIWERAQERARRGHVRPWWAGKDVVGYLTQRGWKMRYDGMIHWRWSDERSYAKVPISIPAKAIIDSHGPPEEEADRMEKEACDEGAKL